MSDARFTPAAALARREREFRAARRHSALVRVLRWGLPGLGIAAAGLFASSYVISARLTVPVGPVTVAVDAARLTREGIVMDKPRVSGTTAQGQRFEVRATRAWQNPTNPKLVNFETIEAEMGLKDGGEAVLTAREGVYDSEHETLKIAGEIQVRSSQGYSAVAQEAFVDFAAGTLRTERTVVLESKDMRIEASSATAHGGDQRIEFTGPVRMTVRPRSEPEP